MCVYPIFAGRREGGDGERPDAQRQVATTNTMSHTHMRTHTYTHTSHPMSAGRAYKWRADASVRLYMCDTAALES